MALRSSELLKLPPVRAITLDLDDTLWPIQPVIKLAEQRLHLWLQIHCPLVVERWTVADRMALREKIAVDRPEIRHDFSAQRIATIAHMLDECGYPSAMVDAAFEVFFDARHEVRLFPEVRPVLERLSQHYPLAGITNGNAELARVGLPMFSFCLHARHHEYPKPHRCLFDAAVARLGIEPEEILHVGDHPEQDVAAARDAGYQVVWANRVGNRWAGPGAAPISIESLDQLLPLLAAANRA